jgi:hypothetical protein
MATPSIAIFISLPSNVFMFKAQKNENKIVQQVPASTAKKIS